MPRRSGSGGAPVARSRESKSVQVLPERYIPCPAAPFYPPGKHEAWALAVMRGEKRCHIKCPECEFRGLCGPGWVAMYALSAEQALAYGLKLQFGVRQPGEAVVAVGASAAATARAAAPVVERELADIRRIVVARLPAIPVTAGRNGDTSHAKA